ncbi:AbrB/MazE/SpoVT family DNA-binding antitoxin (plasmid) [Candidatus Trichorickettsia mobilis]|uniref:AbrB/MazE/SpoVT family DNA-binding antitoxin n=1 Tax=Candidatus Trichorickettsia mobilis TaxID=1346319 RepID=A0ABZ0UV42_9RICK|nr:AbrB/MazE/SpoVT family DNA-binding domain-containing protein [Candidatus Trichorickettsia mobilis]WPY01513.1 AbrB/MazE/SpoVT family DNA-binding antitoxin [Candidatus Trichorickettsia mobilis]
MYSQVKKWGNSLGVRVPKRIASELNLKDGTNVNVKVEENRLVISSDISELDMLVNKITEANRHEIIFSDAPVGKETW